VANLLTVVRVALIPLFLVMLYQDGGRSDGWRFAAAWVFALAAVTDRIDGELARKRGLITEFGKLLDPIADKALIGAALIALADLGSLPWWVAALLLAREIGVTLLRFWVIRFGVIAASRGGKVKTLLQAVAIDGFVLPPWAWARTIAWVVMVAAIVVALATAVDYVKRAVLLRRRSRNRVVVDNSTA
jgi:CDP-diacylglycerol--glycerol-3-phosphate 3-phosphatidyltransferase